MVAFPREHRERVSFFSWNGRDLPEFWPLLVEQVMGGRGVKNTVRWVPILAPSATSHGDLVHAQCL